MRIGIIVDNELNNDNRVLREIEILKLSGNEIFVLCFDFGNKLNSPGTDISVTRINLKKKLKDILFLFLNTIPVYEWLWSSWIETFILKNKIDVLHVHDLYMSRAAHNGVKKTLKKVPLILDLHENYPFAVTTYNWTKGFLRSRISRTKDWVVKEREYLFYADRIIVLSDDFRDLLISRYSELSESNFTSLPNVPDLSMMKGTGSLPVTNLFKQNSPVLFYYGVIAERRGVFDTLSVFTDLVKEKVPVNFLLIGPVDKKDKTHFYSLINLKEIAGQIHYIPWINSAELPAYLNIIDICIAPFHKNPQHESGVANKIYEYMYGAKPIIVSDCIPQQKLIEKHNCGLVFKNLKELHDSIITLVKDPELRSIMGQNGLEAVIKNYNIETIKENLLQLYSNF